MISISTLKKIGLFAGGVLFGTAGVKVLSSKDAKKVYTNCTAAALRAKDCVMKTATTVQEMRRIFWPRLSRSMKGERRRKLRLSRRMQIQKIKVRKILKKRQYNRP